MDLSKVLAWIRKRLDSNDTTVVSSNDFGFHLSAFSETLGPDDQSVFSNLEEKWESEQSKMKALDKSPYSSSIFAADDRRGSLDSVDDMKRRERWLGPMKRRR